MFDRLCFCQLQNRVNPCAFSSQTQATGRLFTECWGLARLQRDRAWCPQWYRLEDTERGAASVVPDIVPSLALHDQRHDFWPHKGRGNKAMHEVFNVVLDPDVPNPELDTDVRIDELDEDEHVSGLSVDTSAALDRRDVDIEEAAGASVPASAASVPGASVAASPRIGAAASPLPDGPMDAATPSDLDDPMQMSSGFSVPHGNETFVWKSTAGTISYYDKHSTCTAVCAKHPNGVLTRTSRLQFRVDGKANGGRPCGQVAA